MKSVFAFGVSLAAVALLSLACSTSSTSATPALSPDDPDPPITVCDPAKCAPGNECIAMDGDLKCRKPCASNVDPGTNCPANFYCASTNEPSVIPPECTKVASVSRSKTICAPFSTATGTRLNAYECGEATPKGC